jgi:poly(A) polymerase
MSMALNQQSRIEPAWLNWPQTQSLIEAFAVRGDALRFVGGAVRDALLDREVQDVDAATLLLPSDTMALLEKSGIRVIPTGVAHGTVTAVIGGKSFEITTLRKDITTDGRHAEVAYTDDWKVDASRRDFTMNALYLSPSGDLFDYFGGAEDARAGRVRFIGDANKRISEDFLRALRFFRFYAHYGIGEPDADALAACGVQASYIATLSGERVQHELSKLLQAPKSFATLQLMQQHHIYPYALGFSLQHCELFERLDAIVSMENLIVPTALRLAGFIVCAAINHEDAHTKMVTRLRLSNHVDRLIQQIVRHYPAITPTFLLADQKRLIRRIGGEDFMWAVMMGWANGTDSVERSHPYHAMLELAMQWLPPTFPMGGEDLIAQGFRQGKEMGEMLAKLEEHWEASNYSLSKDELLTLAKQ